jgi:hypothetical protein
VEGKDLKVSYYDTHESRLLSIDVSLSVGLSIICNNDNHDNNNDDNNVNNNNNNNNSNIYDENRNNGNNTNNFNFNKQIELTTEKPPNLNITIYHKLKKEKQNFLCILYGDYIYIITQNLKLDILKISNSSERSLKEFRTHGDCSLNSPYNQGIYICTYKYTYVYMHMLICTYMHTYTNMQK